MNMEQNSNKESNVAPTDLRNTDIEMFGQEKIPYMDMHRKNHISDMSVTSGGEYNNIGTVPPGSYTDAMPKKIRINKNLFLVIIFLVIALIGGGIYFYLSSTKKIAQKAVVTKNITISVGDELSLKLDDYATFNGVKPTNCILDYSDVKNDVPGKYTYVISCGVNEYKGTIKVEDNLAPSVSTKMVIKGLSEDIEVSEFIVSCEDNSECKYELVNFDELKENIKSEGIYDAKIKISDEFGNERILVEQVSVSEMKADGILKCSYDELKLDNYNASYNIVEYTIYSGDFGDLVISNILFTFYDKEEYNKIKATVTETGELTIEGIAGRAYFLDDSSLSLLTVSNIDDLNYFKSNELSNVEDFYVSNGYICNIY